MLSKTVLGREIQGGDAGHDSTEVRFVLVFFSSSCFVRNVPKAYGRDCAPLKERRLKMCVHDIVDDEVGQAHFSASRAREIRCK